MDVEELRRQVEQDAGDPAFADLADFERTEGRLEAALNIALSGLSANPTCHRGRLVLARIFFELEYYPFAVRELEQLSEALPGNRSIAKLLEKLSPGGEAASKQSEVTEGDSDSAAGEETVAEAEFGFDDIDLISEED